MKKTLLVARILTWFNLVVWGIFLGLGLLIVLVSQQLPLLGVIFLLSSIPLHSYAATKLHKSIRFSNVKLSNQTPVGIRFIGFIALFFGISMVVNSTVMISDPKAAMEIMKSGMPEAMRSNALTPGTVVASGVVAIILGLAIVVNVPLNMRLLRWYYLVKKSDVS